MNGAGNAMTLDALVRLPDGVEQSLVAENVRH
jgi:hypothetical protein